VGFLLLVPIVWKLVPSSLSSDFIVWLVFFFLGDHSLELSVFQCLWREVKLGLFFSPPQK
jgi:hypothetical protein